MKHQGAVIEIIYKTDVFQLASEELGLGRKSPLREKSGLHPAEDVGIVPNYLFL